MMRFFDVMLDEDIDLERDLDLAEDFDTGESYHLLVVYLFDLTLTLVCRIFPEEGAGLGEMDGDPIMIALMAPAGEGVGEGEIEPIIIVTLIPDESEGIGEGEFGVDVLKILSEALGEGVGSGEVLELRTQINMSGTGYGVGGGRDGTTMIRYVLMGGEGVGSGCLVDAFIFDIKPKLWRSGKTVTRKDVDSKRYVKSV